MPKQLLITTLGQSQVAVMQGDKLCRLLSEDETAQAGDVYLAKVVRVLPALSVAFLDIGEDKNAILSLPDTPLTDGQRLIVQLTRPAYAQKGATVTTAISLSSPYVVYKPNGAGVGVSAKLPKSTAQPLKKTLSDALKASSIQGGVVVRTSAQNIDPSDLMAHLEYLHEAWQDILRQKSTLKTPSRLYRPPLPLIALSEHPDINAIHTDDDAIYDEWQRFAKHYLPTLSVAYHPPSLFDAHHIYTQLQNALNRHVALPCGAYLVIDVCEAMTVIDVNTGTLTHSSKNLIHQANLEAVQTIASELMLRQIGGLVVVDLIDMKDKRHQEEIYQAFKLALADDIAQVRLLPMNEFGLISLSREQKLLSFSHKYTNPCPHCQATGRVGDLSLMTLEIVSKLTSLSQAQHPKDEIILRLSQALHTHLSHDDAYRTVETALESILTLKIMADYPPQKYDILQNKHG